MASKGNVPWGKKGSPSEELYALAGARIVTYRGESGAGS